jgi:hypothetical protein
MAVGPIRCVMTKVCLQTQLKHIGKWRFSSTHFQPRHLMVMNDQPHAPVNLNPHKRPRYHLNRRLGGPQSGLDILEKKWVSYTPGGNRTPDRPVRSVVTILTVLFPEALSAGPDQLVQEPDHSILSGAKSSSMSGAVLSYSIGLSKVWGQS